MTDEAFAQGIVDMRQTLYRISYGLLRQEQDRRDAVQETLARAWEKRQTLREEGYLRTWVTRILINECYNILRHQQRVRPTEDLPLPAPPPDADPDVHDALLRLPDKLRLPVMLFYMEGYTIREIAALLRLPQGTVGTRLHRARLRLGAELGDWEEVSPDGKA